MKSAFFSIKLLIFHERRDVFCSSDNGIFFTGKTRQAMTTLAYLYTPTIGALYLVRFLNGFGYGTVSTATNAIVTAYIPASKKGEGINYYGLSTSLANTMPR